MSETKERCNHSVGSYACRLFPGHGGAHLPPLPAPPPEAMGYHSKSEMKRVNAMKGLPMDTPKDVPPEVQRGLQQLAEAKPDEAHDEDHPFSAVNGYAAGRYSDIPLYLGTPHNELANLFCEAAAVYRNLGDEETADQLYALRNRVGNCECITNPITEEPPEGDQPPAAPAARAEEEATIPPQPCGFWCSPAMDDAFGCIPKNNLPPCNHGKDEHYSIDGEAVGCEECEAIVDGEIGYVVAEPPAAPQAGARGELEWCDCPLVWGPHQVLHHPAPRAGAHIGHARWDDGCTAPQAGASCDHKASRFLVGGVQCLRCYKQWPVHDLALNAAIAHLKELEGR